MRLTDFTDILARARRIISTDLLATGPDLQDSTDLFAAGMDSMAIMQLLLMLEEEFGTPIQAEEVTRENFRTIRDVASLVASRLAHVELPSGNLDPEIAAAKTDIHPSAPSTEDAPIQTFRSLELKNCDYFVLSFDAMMRAKGEGGHVAHSILELDRLPDLEALRRGIAEATRRYPLLSARLERSWWLGLPRWQMGRDLIAPELILRSETGSPGLLQGALMVQDADEEISRLINTPLPSRDDARWMKMRVCVVERRNGTATLMLSWSHFVVDGKGAELFLLALNDLGSHGRTNIPALEEPAPLEDRHAGQRWEAAAPVTYRFEEMARHRFDSLASRRHADSGPIRYEVRVLDEQQSAAVKARSRSYSELVNLPFQLACAMRAHQAVFEARGTVPDSLLCSVPVQTRRPGTVGPIFQNHLRMFFSQCLRDELRTLDDAVSSITAQHQRYVKEGLGRAFDELMNLMRPMPPGLYMRMVKWRMRGQFNSFFHSDTGEFAPGLNEFLGASITTAYHIPGFSSPPGTGLFVNEKHGRIVLANCWRGDVLTSDERRMMWERWLDDLGATSSQSES